MKQLKTSLLPSLFLMALLAGACGPNAPDEDDSSTTVEEGVAAAIAWRGGAGPQRQGYGRNPLMHGPGKSDPPIVPGKRPNKPGRPGAEAVEGRGGAKGTAGRQSTGRTQSRETVSQALACVREAAGMNGSPR